MNLVKALDAAFPPSPAEWVADLQSVGAKVGFAYCPTFGGGGSGHYTAAHVEAAEAAGIRVVPIVVPGGSPPSPPLYAAAWPLGMTGGSIVYDIARGDGTPAAAWVEQAAAEGMAADPVWDPWCYLQPDLRPTFPWGKEWAAIPGAEPTSLPDGANGVQYGFDVVINGHNYDVSVIDLDALVASPSAAPVAPPRHRPSRRPRRRQPRRPRSASRSSSRVTRCRTLRPRTANRSPRSNTTTRRSRILT